MKNVKIYRCGKLLKQFTCNQVDAAFSSIIFRGVPLATGPGEIDISHYGRVRWEVNYLDNTMTVEIIGDPEISIFITW
jgi:hypothetical protein